MSEWTILHHRSDLNDSCQWPTTDARIAILRSEGAFANRPLKLAFISDLHLFSSRCHYDHHHDQVQQAIEPADVCVWGGDLFDFCWSMIGDDVQSRHAAIQWLQEWRERYPEKAFVYLMGNHDAQPAFQRDLMDWACDRPTSPSPHQGIHEIGLNAGCTLVGLDAIRIGDSVLVHGDVIEIKPNKLALQQYRARWCHELKPRERPPKMRNGLYNAAVNARLHLAAAGIAHQHRRVCLKLLRWIRRQPDEFHQGVQRVVFGHTHRRLRGRSVAGVAFYNGGAAVKHCPFEPVVCTIESSALGNQTASSKGN